VYTRFEDMRTPKFMFTPYLNTCFHSIWRFVYTMLEDMCAICLERSFNHVWGHVSTMFKDMFTPCLVYVYTIFEEKFSESTLCFNVFSNYVWGHVYTKTPNWCHFFKMFEPIFIQNWSNCSFCWKWIKTQNYIISKYL